jgi:hypothetical protein
MEEVAIIGVDLAKNVFQLQGLRWTGRSVRNQHEINFIDLKEMV